MNEIQITELQHIEIKILFHKQQTIQSALEVGSELIKAKELVPHGSWSDWLETKVNFSQERARQLMIVAREYSNSNTSLNLGFDKMFALTTLDESERETFIEENPVEDMTTRQLARAIKDKKELEQEVHYLKNRPTETIEKIVEKIPDDYQYTKTVNKNLEDKMRTLSRIIEDKNLKIESFESEKELLERKAKLNEKEAIKYNNLTKDIENLTREKNDIGRQITAKTELSALVVRIEHILKTELAPIKYSRAINEVSTDVIIVRNLRDIVGRVQDWCEEMYRYIPMETRGQIIEMEVLENEY